jgi:hypothetical protein
MKYRALTAASVLAGASVVSVIASNPAYADFASTNHLSCQSITNYAQYWLSCTTDYTTGNTWWVNGTHNTSFDGLRVISFNCNKYHEYTIGIDLDNAAAESVTLYCQSPF